MVDTSSTTIVYKTIILIVHYGGGAHYIQHTSVTSHGNQFTSLNVAFKQGAVCECFYTKAATNP